MPISWHNLIVSNKSISFINYLGPKFNIKSSIFLVFKTPPTLPFFSNISILWFGNSFEA